MISRTGRGGSTVSTRIRHLLISLGCILVLTTGCLPVPPPPRPTPAPDGTTSSASPSPYSPADSQLDFTADWNGVGAAQVGDTAA